MFFFEKRHKILNDFQENRFLLFQDVESRVLAQFERLYETGIFDESHSVIGLDFECCCDSLPHRLFLDIVIDHVFEYSPGCRPLSQLDIRHHEVLLVFVTQHIFQVSLQFLSQEVATSDFLYFDDLQSSFIEVNFDEVP